MESFLVYMAKASVLIALFYTAYYTLLRKETFFNTNRWFLLAGLATAATLPLLVYTKVIWIAAPKEPAQHLDLYTLMKAQTLPQTASSTISINWYDVLGGMYLAGVLLFFARFLTDLRAIVRIIKGSVALRAGKFRLIDSPAVSSPFSFFNFIVYNSALLEADELRDIIAHEKVHSSQKHSLDMILGQLFCIAFWFNPFAWMYKKSVSQNLEFIADAGATKLLNDRIAYQKTLLKITMQPGCASITNHFYQSLIKKRIVMLNIKKSKPMNSWKYAVVLPALVAFMLLFQVKTVAQEKQPAATSSEKVKIALEVNKDSKDADLEADKKVFKEEFDTDVTFSNITRNGKSEITGIKVAVKDKSQSKVYEVAGTEPISPFTIEVEKNSEKGMNSISFGEAGNRGRIARSMVYRKLDTIPGSRAIVKGYIFNNDDDEDVVVAPPAPPAPGFTMPAMPRISRNGNTSLVIANDDLLVVVDGVKQKKGEQLRLAPNREIAAITMLNDKDGKKKYGKDGKKGVVEITTKKAGDMVYYRSNGPHILRFPDGEAQADNFSFEFNMDDLGDDFVQIFGNEGDVMKLLPEGFMEDQMRTAEEQIRNAQAQIYKMRPELKAKAARERNENIEEARKEIEEARKAMEEARKELEEARKELQAKRKEMNKKV